MWSREKAALRSLQKVALIYVLNLQRIFDVDKKVGSPKKGRLVCYRRRNFSIVEHSQKIARDHMGSHIALVSNVLTGLRR